MLHKQRVGLTDVDSTMIVNVLKWSAFTKALMQYLDYS